ncbi:MAG: hypothetical protein SPI20_04845, partial [Ruminococcus callidus]|nr:hypothetical protein [Ruminococcus sp.]MDY6145016.1 hypothetical protein [Ruminococcus callidus]
GCPQAAGTCDAVFRTVITNQYFDFVVHFGVSSLFLNLPVYHFNTITIFLQEKMSSIFVKKGRFL